jgi:hypothetical protein
MGRGVVAAITAAVALALPAAPASAEPVSFAHGTLEQQLTTTKPNSPTGWKYDGRYHAAGDPSQDPPYMRRMTFYPPPGQRYDFSVPEQCTASDLELQLRGPSGCPAGSRVAGGVAYGKFMGESTELPVDVFNNEREQVMVVSTPLVPTVIRGEFGDDGSITYESPTCFPALPPGCPIDTALQTGSSVSGQPVTRVIDGVRRSYITTPAKCPKSSHWSGMIHFWWADGTEDDVAVKQPCTRPKRTASKRRRSG